MTVAEDLRGAQRPRLSLLPERSGTAGPAAIALADMAGLTLDPWQAWCVDQILGERADGAMYWNPILNKWTPKSAVHRAALVIARQNGKGAILEACELAWLYLLGAGWAPSALLHTAHESATAKEHFQRVEGLVSGTPELKAELGKGGIRLGNGEWQISLATGQRILFKTRTKGAARGFTVAKLVLDEAMYLTSDQVKATEFATSAAEDPQIIMTGSAGDRDSVHFGKARANGMKGVGKRLFFAEWSANLCSPMCENGPGGQFICREHEDRSKPETWARANPGYGVRLSPEDVMDEFHDLPAEDFDVERLSVGDWPSEGEAWAIITKEGWENCLDEVSRPEPPVTFAIVTSPDKRWTAIVAASGNGEGCTHIEVTGTGQVSDYRSGTSWVVERAIEINKRHRNAQWVIDKATQASVYVDELEKARLKVIIPTARDYAQACGQFFVAIMPIGDAKSTLRHSGQPELASSVAAAEKRDVADMWAWDKKNATGDISCLVAATLAVWGHQKRVNKPKSKPGFAWG